MDSSPGLPQYITSLEEILWGSLLVAFTLTIHGFGMLWTLRGSNAFKARFGQRPSFVLGMSNLILASWMVTFVHIFEVMLWASFFQWQHCFVNYSTAAYFALMDYTTVGSKYNLPQNWRLLEGMLAIAGLLGFAWSTGILLTLAQQFQDQQMQLRKRPQRKQGTHPAPAPSPHADTTRHD